MATFWQTIVDSIKGACDPNVDSWYYIRERTRREKEAALRQAELEKDRAEMARCQAVFDKHEAELSFIMKRARDQYASLGAHREMGTFGEYAAEIRYGDTGMPSRIDIYYPDSVASRHGHIVIKNGVVDVWRDIDGTDILNGRKTVRRRS